MASSKSDLSSLLENFSLLGQTGNRRIEEKNDADGHFMEFLIHDQMDQFKPFTWSEKSRMKCLDEFYVEEGNGTYFL